MKQQIKIRAPKDIIVITEKWRKRREENFLAITLNGAHREGKDIPDQFKNQELYEFINELDMEGLL